MVYPELYVGIDVSKLKHDVAVVNEQKQRIGKAFVVKEKQADYQTLLERLQALQQKYQIQKFFIGLEATSEYWKNLYHFLTQQSQVFSVTVINPVQTRKWADAESKDHRQRRWLDFVSPERCSVFILGYLNRFNCCFSISFSFRSCWRI